MIMISQQFPMSPPAWSRLVSGSQTVGVGGVPRGRGSRQGWLWVTASTSGGGKGVHEDCLGAVMWAALNWQVCCWSSLASPR